VYYMELLHRSRIFGSFIKTRAYIGNFDPDLACLCFPSPCHGQMLVDIDYNGLNATLSRMSNSARFHLFIKRLSLSQERFYSSFLQIRHITKLYRCLTIYHEVLVCSLSSFSLDCYVAAKPKSCLMSVFRALIR
jgi:hypothetical protein